MESPEDQRVQRIRNAIKSYQDFPKPGVIFRDVFPILRNPSTLSDLISLMKDIIRSRCPQVGTIIGLDSRGFLFGPILSLELDLPFVPVRKSGKLSGETKRVTFQLEYGSDSVEMQVDAVKPNSQVVIVDDLLATGGTMEAACKLVEAFGATAALCLVVIELLDIKGRDRLKAPVAAVVQY